MGSGPEPAEFQEGSREARRVIVGTPEEFSSLRSRKGQAATNNPKGKPRGTRVSKWSENKLRALLDYMGADSEKIVKKVIKKALDDNDKDQAAMLKLCMDRLIPATKAVEVHGFGGREIAIRVLVDSVESFNNVRLIDGERVVNEQIN